MGMYIYIYMKRSTNLEEEAQQLERDVDKIKLDVQDAIKKVGLDI